MVEINYNARYTTLGQCSEVIGKRGMGTFYDYIVVAGEKEG